MLLNIVNFPFLHSIVWDLRALPYTVMAQ